MEIHHQGKKQIIELPYAHKAIVISSCAFLIVACILAGILCIKACLMQKADDDLRTSTRNTRDNKNDIENGNETDNLRRTVNSVKIAKL
uniref:Col_cuticle_N domain-containing protein n=1 Tax=Strongyloides papillosus TaxID=174720 RepID=A0A0N5C387_STREA